MKKNLLSCMLFIFATSVSVMAQDLPSNPEPGKCYVRCKTPDVWKNESVSIQVAPAYKTISTNPAQYKNESFTVVGTEAGQTLRVIPAKFQNENFQVTTEEASFGLQVIKANKGKSETQTIVTEEDSYRLEIVPAVYENKSFTIEVQPTYKKLVVIPAKYETRTQNVICQIASTRLEVIPGAWGTEQVSYRAKEFGTTLKVVPATFGNSSKTIEVKAATAVWQMSDVAPDCESSDPNDCRYWCYKPIAAQHTTISQQTLVRDASVIRDNVCDDPDCGQATYTKKVMTRKPTTKSIAIPEIAKTYTTRVMVTPPTTREIVVPAIFKTFTKRVMVTPPTTRKINIAGKSRTITKTAYNSATTRRIDYPSKSKTMVRTKLVSAATTAPTNIPSQNITLKRRKLVKDAWSNEVSIAAKYSTVTKEVLVTKGGLTTWKEVDCKLTINSPLPIKWNLGSATLTSTAKGLIDTRLLPILRNGLAVAIESHTDSRGSKTSNQNLSERRARSVVNYLISKGINSSKLTANGYGENRLTNRCSDGVSCNEREHQQNRRTTFRVINQ